MKLAFHSIWQPLVASSSSSLRCLPPPLAACNLNCTLTNAIFGDSFSIAIFLSPLFSVLRFECVPLWGRSGPNDSHYLWATKSRGFCLWFATQKLPKLFVDYSCFSFVFLYLILPPFCPCFCPCFCFMPICI